jgi:hypothetical protein
MLGEGKWSRKLPPSRSRRVKIFQVAQPHRAHSARATEPSNFCTASHCLEIGVLGLCRWGMWFDFLSPPRLVACSGYEIYGYLDDELLRPSVGPLCARLPVVCRTNGVERSPDPRPRRPVQSRDSEALICAMCACDELLCVKSFFSTDIFYFFSIMYLRGKDGVYTIIPLVWYMRGAEGGSNSVQFGMEITLNLGTRYKAAHKTKT